MKELNESKCLYETKRTPNRGKLQFERNNCLLLFLSLCFFQIHLAIMDRTLLSVVVVFLGLCGTGNFAHGVQQKGSTPSGLSRRQSLLRGMGKGFLSIALPNATNASLTDILETRLRDERQGNLKLNGTVDRLTKEVKEMMDKLNGKKSPSNDGAKQEPEESKHDWESLHRVLKKRIPNDGENASSVHASELRPPTVDATSATGVFSNSSIMSLPTTDPSIASEDVKVAHEVEQKDQEASKEVEKKTEEMVEQKPDSEATKEALALDKEAVKGIKYKDEFAKFFAKMFSKSNS